MLPTCVFVTVMQSTVLPGDEAPLVGALTFHEFGRYVGGGSAALAIVLSLLLIWLHALNYTKPYEQRQYVF
jgi:hypothetical protein